MANPKLFISYSWSTSDHEDWVLRLATELRQAGVDVILDKWDLKEGHDAHAFMERMVTDAEIKKVALVCDRLYVEKANGRSGGVGTETQIISAEVYASQDQNKFVALVRDRDEQRQALVPAYYRSRIHIDFSDERKESESFEQLLRWIYDKPLHQKPELGATPAFLVNDQAVLTLSTTVQFRRALDAVLNARPQVVPAVTEYFETFATQLEKIRLPPNATPFDDAVVGSIEAFRPYRNEMVEMFLHIAAYLPEGDTAKLIRHLFERLIPYLEKPENVSQFRDWDWDNFRFIVPELFLFSVASLLKRERFVAAADLLSAQYFIPGRSEYGRDVMVDFSVFSTHLKSLEERNRRLAARGGSRPATMA